MNLRDKLKPKASPPPLPPLPARRAERRPVREMSIGAPAISVELYGVISAVGDATIRRFTSTFRPPGKHWGDPEVTAMRVMFAAALESAVTKTLESVTAVTLPADIPRENSVGPFPDDEPTVPTARRA